MAYSIRVYSNSHYLDESESYLLSETFTDYEVALAAARKIVEACIAVPQGDISRKTAEMLSQYKMFGDDPVIIPAPDGPTKSFSAWAYAEHYIRVLTGDFGKEQKTPPLRFSSLSYHDNSAQFVQECARFLQQTIQRFCPKFSVEIGEVKWKFDHVIRGYYDYSINTATAVFHHPSNGDHLKIEVWHDWNFEEENSVHATVKTGLLPATYHIGLSSDQLDGYGYIWGKIPAEDWEKVIWMEDEVD